MTQPPVERPPLDAASLAALAPRWRVEVLPETPSTNAVCAERARAGEADGLVVTTEHQYAGRGRLDRGWEMPPRSAIAMSVLLRPSTPVQHWPWIPLVTGIAVARAVGEPARVKWPNDVLIEERKLCGILVERVETGAGAAAIVGIGLNVSLGREEIPVATGTSLEPERDVLATPYDRPIDRAALIGRILDELDLAMDGLGSDPSGTLASYTALSATVGRRVRVELPTGELLEGTATAIESDGRLVVAGPDGPVAVAAGDVVHARLA